MTGGRRAGAWAVDFVVTVGVAVLIGSWLSHHVATVLTDLPGAATDTVHGLASGEDADAAAVDFGLAVLRHAAIVVMLGFAGLVLVVFAYQFVALAWVGRTLGKALFDLRVRRAASAGLPGSQLTVGRAAGRAALGTLTDIGFLALACGLLLGGQFVLSATMWAVAVAAFWINLTPLIVGRRRTVIDLLADTEVVPGNQHRQLARTLLGPVRDRLGASWPLDPGLDDRPPDVRREDDLL